MPELVEGKRCIPYHFRFQSLRTNTAQRLPEVVRRRCALLRACGRVPALC